MGYWFKQFVKLVVLLWGFLFATEKIQNYLSNSLGGLRLKRWLSIIDYNNRFALKIRPFRNKMGHRPGLQSISSIILFSILIYCRGLAKMLLDLTLLKWLYLVVWLSLNLTGGFQFWIGENVEFYRRKLYCSSSSE